MHLMARPFQDWLTELGFTVEIADENVDRARLVVRAPRREEGVELVLTDDRITSKGPCTSHSDLEQAERLRAHFAAIGHVPPADIIRELSVLFTDSDILEIVKVHLLRRFASVQSK